LAEVHLLPTENNFESGFPHGKDQFISAFATGWGTEALLMSLAQERRRYVSDRRLRAIGNIGGQTRQEILMRK
jgi:hypothetical protein